MSYKAAVVGCGRMGAFTSESVKKFAPKCWFPLAHIEAICAHTKLKLVAIGDANINALVAASKKYLVSDCYQDAKELFAKHNIDILSIATRTINRAELMLEAINYGVKAMHVEKPLCNSMKELKACEDKFQSKNLFLTLGAIRRYMNPYQIALKIAHSGKYGQLNKIQINMGCGGLYWTHPHSVDLILFAADGRKVLSVGANLTNVVRGDSEFKIKSDPVINEAQINFEGGLKGVITNQGGCDFILSCENAQIIVEADGHSLYVYGENSKSPYYERQNIPTHNSNSGGTLSPIAHLVECIDGNEVAIKLNAKIKSDIFLGQRILFGFMQSHITNNTHLSLDEISNDMEIMAEYDGKYA
jgi:predicted dehydrogenase